MKKVVVLVTDQNYLEHTKALFAALKLVGKWDGDYCMVTNNFTLSEAVGVLHFIDKGIDCFPIDESNPFYAKYHLFSSYFKQWDRVIYFDADFVITGDINHIVETNGKFLADFENKPIKKFFDEEANPALFKELQNEFDVNLPLGFNSGCMVYDTDLIGEDDETLKYLLALQNKYKEINHHTGLPEGTDQPILNIAFYKYLKQIPGVAFHRKRKSDTVAMHTCRWEAPWKDSRYINYYKENLRRFNNEF